jgi:UDP-N-acetylglucosamine diphosphorylase/glucosamine-1-phosphate N-acetyltransferase
MQDYLRFRFKILLRAAKIRTYQDEIEMSITKAIILAAGEGTRMRPLTCIRPKVMLPLAGKPIIEHLFIETIKAGIKDYIFIVGYHDEAIREYFGNGARWNADIRYINQKAQCGTADALRNVAELIDGDFLVLNGDAIFGYPDIAGITDTPGNIIGVKELTKVSGLGVVETEGDRVTQIHEKLDRPPCKLANTGLYRFTVDIFDAISHTGKSPRGEYEITDSIRMLIENGHPVGYRKIERWLDFSYPWDLLAANETVMTEMLPDIKGEIEENAVIEGAVSLGENSVIRAGSYITGPVIIGKDCTIGPNCYIRPSTVIGDHCHIGSAVEIKNSIIMSDTNVPHQNYVGDSIIGKNCNLGAGTKIANLRLDKRNIVVSGIDTGRNKLGVIIGDGVQTGINSSINAGTLIGHDTFIGPGAFARGIIAPGSRIF